jgi:hypothetical protein
MFGAHPLETERGKGLLKCRKCAKVVAEASAGEHVRMSLPHLALMVIVMSLTAFLRDMQSCAQWSTFDEQKDGQEDRDTQEEG